MDLRTYETVRKLQKNPGLGAYRMQAALEQMGIYISRVTCGTVRWKFSASSPASATIPRI